MIVYTKHVEEKLKRKDIKSFKINKKLIKRILDSEFPTKRTKTGECAIVKKLTNRHDLRIIYDIIGKDIKVITFHIARKGRY
jgi:hypothetical protein